MSQSLNKALLYNLNLPIYNLNMFIRPCEPYLIDWFGLVQTKFNYQLIFGFTFSTLVTIKSCEKPAKPCSRAQYNTTDKHELWLKCRQAISGAEHNQTLLFFPPLGTANKSNPHQCNLSPLISL